MAGWWASQTYKCFLPQLESQNVRILCKICRVFWLGKLWDSGVLNWILPDTGRELFKTKKLGLPGKPRTNGISSFGPTRTSSIAAIHSHDPYRRHITTVQQPLVFIYKSFFQLKPQAPVGISEIVILLRGYDVQCSKEVFVWKPICERKRTESVISLGLPASYPTSYLHTVSTAQSYTQFVHGLFSYAFNVWCHQGPKTWLANNELHRMWKINVVTELAVLRRYLLEGTVSPRKPTVGLAD